MNSDDIRDVQKIKSNRYWRKGQTLGEGGWTEVYKFASDWKVYELDIAGETVDVITAQNDDIAIKAFHSLYDLEDTFVYWQIDEKIVEYRTLLVNDPSLVDTESKHGS